MPTYEYECLPNGHRFEIKQSFSDDPIAVCQVCAEPVRKVYSAAGLVFKGSGYYVTDTRGKPPSKDGVRKVDGDGGGKDAGETGSASKDGGSKDGGSKDSGSKDSGSKDSGSKDSGSKDGASKAGGGSKDRSSTPSRSSGSGSSAA